MPSRTTGPKRQTPWSEGPGSYTPIGRARSPCPIDGPEEATADGWSASAPEVQEWAAASDKTFGYDPGGGDEAADETP